MKNLILLITILALSSCEQECRVCTQVVTSNQSEAQLKCEGRANDFPDKYEEISTLPLGEFCDPSNEPKSSETSVNICSGVNATIRTTITCR